MSDAINIFRRVARPTAGAGFTLLVALGLSLFAATLHAGNTGQLPPFSPETRGWINGLTDELGICCGGPAAAVRPQAVDWNDAASFYRVKVDDHWLFVPDEAIVKRSNRLGDAVVWLEYEGDIFSGELTPLVRCFLPASAD